MIRVAIAGVGNCASSLVQGVEYYSNRTDTVGLMHSQFGPYRVGDIAFVAAFDVDHRKVGQDLGHAIFSTPNSADKFCPASKQGIIVQRGPVLDGVSSRMCGTFIVDKRQRAVDVVKALRASKAEMLICYLPVGSARAARYYARACLQAKVGFINAIPEFICSDKSWAKKFKDSGIPCAGDDIKSQVGATILHRVVARLINDRGQFIDSTYQLNIGGNSDFMNMLDEGRLESKRASKTQAVLSAIDAENRDLGVRIGPSDYVAHLRDTKICYINFQGRQFGGTQFELDIKLRVADSPNNAGVMVDVIRAMKIASDRGLSGNLDAISAYAFKSPPVQYRDDIARSMVEEFIAGHGTAGKV